MHTAPGAYVCYMLLEQCTFQIWSWSSVLFKYGPREYSSRLLMVQYGPGAYGPGPYGSGK